MGGWVDATWWGVRALRRHTTPRLHAVPPPHARTHTHRRDLEVKAYAPEYWGGEVWFDEPKAFYMAVHGGKVKRGRLTDLINPWG